MAMIVAYTQYMENYGSAEAPYWKAKGGSSYKILGVPLNQDLQAVVDAAAIGHNNVFSREYVVGWSIEDDDYLSGFERSQMEYEGKITFPEPIIEYKDLVEIHA